MLHQPKDTQTWPIRNEIQVLIRRAGQVGITFREWLRLAGRDDASKEDFPQLLLDHLWKDSGGKPPVIEKLFLHS